MSILYPSALPGPEAVKVEPQERRTLSPLEGARLSRARQREWVASQSLTFVFTLAQAAQFRAWYRDALGYGGAWFEAQWPLPHGGAGLCRFIGPLRWDYLSGAAWRVSADTEVRLLPSPAITSEWVVSGLYPLAEIESYSASAVVAGGFHTSPPTDNYTSAAALVSGALSTILREYASAPEQFAASAAWAGGALTSVLVAYSNWPAEQFAAAAQLDSGTLAAILIQQTIPAEQYAVAATLDLGTLA